VQRRRQPHLPDLVADRWLEEGLRGGKKSAHRRAGLPGISRGGEAGWGLWIAGTDVPPSNIQHAISVAFFSNFVFGNQNWDWKSFDFDKDVALADNKLGAVLNQINPDLSAFKQRSGKLLQYHGWNDPAISPLNSINYFNSVQEKMGDTQDFYRLYMAPGMEHCMGGPGPNQFDRMGRLSNGSRRGKRRTGSSRAGQDVRGLFAPIPRSQSTKDRVALTRRKTLPAPFRKANADGAAVRCR